MSLVWGLLSSTVPPPRGSQTLPCISAATSVGKAHRGICMGLDLALLTSPPRRRGICILTLPLHPGQSPPVLGEK